MNVSQYLCIFSLSYYPVLIVSLLFVGCQSHGQPEGNLSIVGSQVELEKNSSTPEQISHTEIIVSDIGVGGITEGTLFNTNVIQDALPGLKIRTEELATEDEKYPVITAYKKDELIITVIPKLLDKNIASVWVSNNLVLNELGHSIGTQFHNIYVHKINTDCKPGVEELSGYVICSAPSSKHIKYLFEGNWDGPDGELPPVNVLALWRLIKIIWIAPWF
jgi:hypothetical protein